MNIYQLRHFAFYAAVVLGIIVLAAALLFKQPLAYAIGANSFFIVYIALVLRRMPAFTSEYLSKSAQDADEPIGIIFLVTFVIICVAVGSLFLLMNAKDAPHPIGLAFSMLSLPLGWFTIHTMAALHYAHLYWTGDDNFLPTHSRKPVGGLLFPETEKPVGWDFLYYSLVIGMTAQTADTNISTTQMRIATMVHSVLSFFFNTVIVAAAVNLVVSLAS
ncbi:DUF1345 domain-containing protein [Mesorhizobium sp. SB112]|uniref:DUF1345 domain-containing protein n=1 Tax=Mesorhizobium sp. SB112 TaxID=3151853 RepID=UPI0032641391